MMKFSMFQSGLSANLVRIKNNIFSAELTAAVALIIKRIFFYQFDTSFAQAAFSPVLLHER